MGNKLTVTVTKTRDGRQDFVQIMSEDQISINVVFVANEIEVKDGRGEGKVKVKKP